MSEIPKNTHNNKNSKNCHFSKENHEKDREVPEHIDKIRPRKFLGIRMNQVDLPIPHLLFYDFNQTQTCLIRMTIYQKIKTL